MPGVGPMVGVDCLFALKSKAYIDFATESVKKNILPITLEGK